MSLWVLENLANCKLPMLWITGPRSLINQNDQLVYKTQKSETNWSLHVALLTLQCFDLYHCLTNINKLKKSGHCHTYLCITLQLTIQGVFPYWVYDLFVYPCHIKRLSVHQLLCVSSDPLVIWAQPRDKVFYTIGIQLRLRSD